MSAPNIVYPPSSGGGGGGVSGTGTPPALAMWATSSSLTDSPLSFASQTLTLSSSVRFFTFGHHQQWTIPANAYGFAINNQLVLDTGSGYLGINPPTTPASPLHVEGTVGSSSEMVRLRNQLAGINSHVTIQTHANALGGSSPTGKIQNYTTALTPGYGVYDWVYSLPNPNGVMTEVFRQTAPTTILTVTLTSGGSGYTNGTYSQVALTNVSSSGSGATADIVVAGGIVTVAVLRSGGSTYQVGDTLTCASIGGGTGFVLTVASVGSQATAAGYVTATRIGAGTTTPVSTLDSVGLTTIRKSGAYNYLSVVTGVPFNNTSFLTIDTTAEPSGRLTLPASDNGVVFGINTRVSVDASLCTAGANLQGHAASIALRDANAAGTKAVRGSLVAGTVAGPMAGKTISLVYGLDSQASVTTSGGGNIISLLGSASFTTLVTSTVAETITERTGILITGGTLSGAAHSVANNYSLRLTAPSLSGGSTITNRWGISQEDAVANNSLTGATVIGAAPGTVPGANLQVNQSTSGVGTVSVSAGGTNVTGVGTRFTNTFKSGDTITFTTSFGSETKAITSVTNDTAMVTAAFTGSATNVAYTLVGGTRFQVRGNGNLYMDSGYGSAATAYGCRAWVNFNGTGVIAIRASGNVSSITDGGVGVYTLNFTSAMTDVNYAVTASAWYDGVAAGAGGVTARNTTSVQVKTVATQTAALVDMLECHFSIFR